MQSQLSLEGFQEEPELPEGFVFLPEFLSEDEHAGLLAVFDAWDFGEIRMRGVIARRSVRHFGFTYNFDTNALVERDHWPDELAWVRQRAGEFADVDAEKLQEALVMKYPKGAPIGWHKDSPVFGPKVVGISLASSCRMRFRKGEAGTWTTAEIVLPPRSAYVIGGEARSVWQHHIPSTQDLALPRFGGHLN